MHMLLKVQGAGEMRDYRKHDPNLFQLTEQQLIDGGNRHSAGN